jgi:CBS domain-containing protein
LRFSASQERQEPPMITQSVRDVLNKKEIQSLVTVAPESSVADAVRLMKERGMGAVVIRAQAGSIDGIFTERDVMCRVVDEGRDAARTPVSAVMSPNVRQVSADASVEEVLRLMVVHGHRHIVVEDGLTHGLVSIRDLMQWLILPDQPIAPEGRVGVIRARTADTVDAVKGLQP